MSGRKVEPDSYAWRGSATATGSGSMEYAAAFLRPTILRVIDEEVGFWDSMVGHIAFDDEAVRQSLLSLRARFEEVVE